MDEVARWRALVGYIEGQIQRALCPDAVSDLLVRYRVTINRDSIHCTRGMVISLDFGW